MSLVDISPVELLLLADHAEDEAYKYPPGPKRHKMLTMALNMRAYANRAKWDDEIIVKAEVIINHDQPKPLLS